MIPEGRERAPSLFPTGTRIAADPLTASVTAFNYGATSIITGGTPLFFASTGDAFAAYEHITVPEPATLALLVGAAALGARRRSAAARR